jgi:CheY-like chemotaxis protein
MDSQRFHDRTAQESRECGGGLHLVEPNRNRAFDEESAFGPAILLVEDQSFVREVTREVLRAAGYRVVAVRTATDALRVFEEVEGEVDLLLTDVILPEETGLELAARLKRAKQDLNVLYVTGYAEQMKRCDERHETFLAKPFSSEKLLAAVREAFHPQWDESRTTFKRAGDAESLA